MLDHNQKRKQFLSFLSQSLPKHGRLDYVSVNPIFQFIWMIFFVRSLTLRNEVTITFNKLSFQVGGEFCELEESQKFLFLFSLQVFLSWNISLEVKKSSDHRKLKPVKQILFSLR